ncbi:MAG: ABC transporter ATP-binding protein [Candidatus Hermodarchaeota archaeon]
MVWHGGFAEAKRKEDRTSDIYLIRRLLPYTLRYKVQVFLAVFFMLVGTITGLIGPYLLKIGIDDYIAIPEPDFTGLILLAGIYFIVHIFNWLFAFGRIYTMGKVGQYIIYDVRRDMFDHLHDLGLDYYDREPLGRVISFLSNDAETLSNLMSEGILDVITNVVMLFAILVVLWLLSPALTLWTLLVLPMLFVITMIFRSRARIAYQKTRKTIAEITRTYQENISGMRVTQAFNREEYNLKRFNEINQQNFSAVMRSQMIFAFLFPAVDLVNSIGTAIVIWAGVNLSFQGIVSIGTIVAFLSYLTRFFQPILTIAMFYNTLQSGLAAAERIVDLLDEESSVIEDPNAIELPPDIKGSIRFEDVSFEYEPGVPVLQNFNLEIPAGQTYAIVGPTGAGKSTIINLLCRFYPLTKGEISIDGYDINQVTLESLRKNLGIVLQDPFLFSGTIAENIRYSTLSVNTEDIEDAARLIGAYEFINNRPDGFETLVGERGTQISVGQRQLLSFARALLVNPKILVLDEATSSIDAYTEKLIQDGIKNLLRNRTSIVIAHRLSTIQEADRIIVIDNGQIVEEGTFNQLLDLNGKFRDLYEKQFKTVSQKN